ncbi:MAG: hypothetical protein FD146_594 [Anaerolineaceae bacterium]|nr:MAG: hypothetical protein FD146_594 [Anaerolineaceae bacterium]
MKTVRFLLALLILALATLLASCKPEIDVYVMALATNQMATKINQFPAATGTYELQPTMTARPTPPGNYCDDATTAGARTRYTFQEILPCLDTIQEVSAFMAHNMMYDGAYDTRERGGNEYVPAWLVYERGVDDCDGHAILQCYFLEMNGRDAVMLGLNADTDSGHNVCAVDTGEAIIVLDNMGTVIGPFASFEAAALHYIDAGGSLGIIRASQITAITTDATTPSVIDLPWTMIWNNP